MRQCRRSNAKDGTASLPLERQRRRPFQPTAQEKRRVVNEGRRPDPNRSPMVSIRMKRAFSPWPGVGPPTWAVGPSWNNDGPLALRGWCHVNLTARSKSSRRGNEAECGACDSEGIRLLTSAATPVRWVFEPAAKGTRALSRARSGLGTARGAPRVRPCCP